MECLKHNKAHKEQNFNLLEVRRRVLFERLKVTLWITNVANTLLLE